MKAWISAFRLRTLPLALASIGMGAFLAASDAIFRWDVFALCALTTVMLQILSNLANDYGDSVHGADHAERTGPARAVQSGMITQQAMKKALYVLGVLSLLSGLSLLWVSLGDFGQVFWIFLAIGLAAIAAAVTYTAGWRPYGYAGLGDISVLIFFGWVAVLGSYYLFNQSLAWDLLLPASSIGLLSVGVLNVNNIRDMASDQLAGKFSIPVRIGRRKAVIYHGLLLGSAMLLSLAFVVLNYQNPAQFSFFLVTPLLIKNVIAVRKKTDSASLDPYLKQLALTSLLFVLFFGIGQLI